MIKRALASGIEATYVLMDSWFTLPPLVQAIVEQGLDVIGMVKETKQRYIVNGNPVSLKQFYRLAQPVQAKKGILRSIHTVMANGTPVKVVFIRNRNKRSEWLAILSTEKEFQSRSYDALISHTTIVFARFIALAWQNRCHTDQRTLGGLFYELCDEVNELDWAVALQQLIEPSSRRLKTD